MYLLVIKTYDIQKVVKVFSPCSGPTASVVFSTEGHPPSAHLSINFSVLWLFPYSSFVKLFWPSAVVPYLTKKSRVKVSSGWRALDGHGALLNLYHGGVTIAQSLVG